MLDLKNKKIILGSSSPRRKELLSLMDIPFECRVADYDEKFDAHDVPEDTALAMAIGKSEALIKSCEDNDIIITADTIVSIDGIILGKPYDINDAKSMLKKLSGNRHTVTTGVCIADKKHRDYFFACTDVWIKNLDAAEIDYYLSKYSPLDKAGAYGIQEWIGVVGIEKIDGPYFNVMGLPTQMLYEHLSSFIEYES
ncbi:Maf family protein [Odoribacter sp. OttesenSCG-928-L07]|nr:Maf family protein [Odoribacter sp. OttesenSCG-928-L07]MDL2238664.1 Maf family protein [Bacteroidales bacterium OttesenSCG-928-L14]MDL2240299.1 Maf family protein [Bacteroidales bacterium OttesenSCG-928-K22]